MAVATFYMIRCDFCTADLRHHGSSMFPNLDQANEVAIALGWTSPKPRRHICPKCSKAGNE